MCTLAQDLHDFNPNFIIKEEIKEESGEYEAITFEEYKITESEQYEHEARNYISIVEDVAENFIIKYEPQNSEENPEIFTKTVELKNSREKSVDKTLTHNPDSDDVSKLHSIVFKEEPEEHFTLKISCFENNSLMELIKHDHNYLNSSKKYSQQIFTDTACESSQEDPKFHRCSVKIEKKSSEETTKRVKSENRLKVFDKRSNFSEKSFKGNKGIYFRNSHSYRSYSDQKPSTESNKFLTSSKFSKYSGLKRKIIEQDGHSSKNSWIEKPDNSILKDSYYKNKLFKANSSSRKLSSNEDEESEFLSNQDSDQETSVDEDKMRSEYEEKNKNNVESMDEDEDGIQYKEIELDENCKSNPNFEEESLTQDQADYSMESSSKTAKNFPSFQAESKKNYVGFRNSFSERSNKKSKVDSENEVEIIEDSNDEASEDEDLDNNICDITANMMKSNQHSVNSISSRWNQNLKNSPLNTSQVNKVENSSLKLSKSSSSTSIFPHNPSISSSPQNSLKCPDCPMIFEDTLRFNRHKRLHIAPKFQCRNCLKKFKRKSMLKKHHCDIKCANCLDTCTCNKEMSKDCIICQKINFRYFVDYKQHMLSQHKEIVVCSICQKNNFTFFKHKQLGHELTKYYSCTKCTSILKTKEQLENHLKTHLKEFRCEKCGKNYTQRHLLKQHLLTHENPKHFHCEICNKNFQRKFCLDNHKKIIHSNKEKEEKYMKREREMNSQKSVGWVKCDKCPAMFRSNQSRQKHLDQAHLKRNVYDGKKGEVE